MSLKHKNIQMVFFICSISLMLGSLPGLYADWQTPPEQFTTSGSGSSPDISANSKGDAMAVWVDNSIVKASNFILSKGEWGTFTKISTNTGTNSSSHVAFDDSGKALAIWVASGTPNQVRSALFNGTSWSEPLLAPLDSNATNLFQSPAVAMNGSGNGVSAWIELTANEVRASTFSNFWIIATTIGTGDGTVSVAYSSNGSAAAAWTNAGVVTANQFISNSWQVAATVIGSAGDVNPQVGIDSFGKTHVMWLNSGSVKASMSLGTSSWSTPQVISSATGNISPSIAVAPGGTAVATWIDSSLSVQSSIYNGTSWSSPTLVSNSPLAKQADVSVAANGNAVVLWAGSAVKEIHSSSLPLNGSWGNQQTVGILSNPPDQVVSAFSSAGPAFGVWTETDSNALKNAFGAFTLSVILPAPPVSINGKVRVDKFAVQQDRLHIITFEPSKDKTVTFYRLKRNGKIIVEIPAKGPYKYIDHNRSKHQKDVYTLTSVNAGDLESDPLTVILK